MNALVGVGKGVLGIGKAAARAERAGAATEWQLLREGQSAAKAAEARAAATAAARSEHAASSAAHAATTTESAAAREAISAAERSALRESQQAMERVAEASSKASAKVSAPFAPWKGNVTKALVIGTGVGGVAYIHEQAKADVAALTNYLSGLGSQLAQGLRPLEQNLGAVPAALGNGYEDLKNEMIHLEQSAKRKAEGAISKVTGVGAPIAQSLVVITGAGVALFLLSLIHI